jgi:hypothetical protein
MFSYFEKGINDTKCNKFVGLPELRKLISQNPNAEKISTIRNLRYNADENYKSLKSELPYITPNCLLRERNLKGANIENNFIQFSQYLYYDIDVNSNPYDYKKYFVDRYHRQASLVCISSSGGGISVLFKVKNKLTFNNFNEIWCRVKNSILSGETVDHKCKEIGRAMFISYDPDVFCNIENEIEIEIEANSSSNDEKNEEKQSKPCMDFNNNLISPFSIIPIDEVIKKISVHTMVPVLNPIVDLKPVEYVEFYIPKVIKDGTKHNTYTSMIHTLVYLNPDIEREYIFSYLLYINNRFARPRMEKREFIRVFNLIYNGIIKTGRTIVKKEVKYIHFNPQANLTKDEKIILSNLINGFKRKNESIKKIIDAKEELSQKNQQVTQKRIANISKLSPKTIRKYYNSRLYDMDEVVKMVNDSVPTKAIKLSIMGY